MLVDAHRDVAQHVFAESRCWRSTSVTAAGGVSRLSMVKCALRFLLDAERERLDAPVFRIADELAAEALDDALEGGGHLLDLLRAQILARQVDVFVQWHANAFPLLSLVWRQALRAFRERQRSSQEGGNTGRRTMRSYRPFSGTAVRSAPGRDRAEARFIARILPATQAGNERVFGELQARDGALKLCRRSRGSGRQAGPPSGRHRAGSRMRRLRRVRAVLQPVERAEQLFERLCQQHLLEARVGARTRDIRLGNYQMLDDPTAAYRRTLRTSFAPKGCPKVPKPGTVPLQLDRRGSRCLKACVFSEG